MILFKKPEDLHLHLEKQRIQGKKTGFVPTMGALHEGHLSLIRTSAQSGNLTVCSIFVNPTQFNDATDFAKYPVTIEKDIQMLATAHCDILFLPSVHEMYPGGTQLTHHYDLGYLDTILEGKYRPGHFQGVATIVHRLLDMVKPDHLYIGRKDYQQCMVIKKLLEITGKAGSIVLHPCPTLREPDGLAMSSRNARLNDQARKKAVAISQTLQFVKENIKPGELDALKAGAGQRLMANDFKVDYLEIADAETLHPVQFWDGQQRLVVLAAAYIDGVRLIDNIILE